MKTSFYLTAFCLISLSIFLVCAKLETNNGNINIAITETDDSYRLAASYDDANSAKVLRYINKTIEQGGHQPGGGYFDVATSRIDITTTLNDRTVFYINEKPGKLNIELDKRKNSYASYRRIKKMCEGIKDVLAGKQ